MAQQHDMSGSLSRNDKQGNASWPDYKGKIVINGVKYWLSGWIKDGQNGKWVSLSAKPADGSQAKPPAKQSQQDDDFLDDSIPF